MEQKRQPKVCICIPAYNAEKTIGRTLDSLVEQTYQNFIVIIVNNDSRDNTAKIAERYAADDERFRVVNYKENVVAEENFTRCISLAQGDYTAIFHSDDIYAPTMIAEEVSVLEQQPTVGVVFTIAKYINDTEQVIGQQNSCVSAKYYQVFNFDTAFRRILRGGNIFVCSTAMVRTKIYKEEICIWNGAKYRTSADLDVWLRILRRHQAAIIQKPLIFYRVSGQSFSFRRLLAVGARNDMVFTVGDHLHNNPAYADDHECQFYFARLKTRDCLSRSLGHILNKQHKQARKLLANDFWHERSWRFGVRYILYNRGLFLLTLFALPKWVRRAFAYIRYYPSFKGCFKAIDLP